MSVESKPNPFFSHPRKFYSTLIWLLSAIFVFYKFLIVVTPSVLILHLTEAFKINTAQLGLLAGCYFYAFFLFQIPAGILLDKFTSRNMAALGLAICSIGVLLFGLSNSLAMASLARFLMGIGGSFALLTVLKLSSDWFHHEYFAFLNGLMMTFGMLGAIMGQTPFNYIFNIFGWRITIIDIALFGFILAIIYWLIVRDRKTLMAFQVKPAPTEITYKKAFKKIFTSKQNWLLFFYSGLAWTTITAFAGFWGTPFLKIKYHLGDRPAPFVNSMIFFGFAIGAPFFGYLSNRIGKRKPLLFLGTLFALIIFFVIVYLPEVPAPFLAFFLFLLGFSASTYALSFAVIYEINRPIIAMSALAFLNAGNALFGALADPLIGLFIDIDPQGQEFFAYQNVEFALMRLPIYLILSLIFLSFIKETHCKHKYK